MEILRCDEYTATYPSGSSLFAKVPVSGIQVYNGLIKWKY